MESPESLPPRPRTDAILEGAVIGIILFLAVVSLVVRLLLVFAK
ncbi:MAG: hypothetical protein ACREKL_09345 [Chthoniobacterales bacterium]